MKSKFLFQLFLLSGLGIIFITMKSDINGKFNNGTSCGNCHGNVNAATTVALTGLPATFVTGQTYPLTLTITNATNTKADFNVAASGGTFIAGAGSKINGMATQITHLSPASAVNNVTTFSFSWKAPNNLVQVTFNAAGNAVNDDGSDSAADQWNIDTHTLNGSYPAGSGDVAKELLKCYPNPATEQVIIEGVQADKILVYNVVGKKIDVAYNIEGNKSILKCNQLANGTYFVLVFENGKILKTTFVKE